MKRKFRASILLCGLLLASQSAWAYLDPGTGSMIIQGIVAGVTGVAVVARLYWAKVKSFFAGEPPYEPDAELDQDAKDESS
mgnify:CR=1 FL=1